MQNYTSLLLVLLAFLFISCHLEQLPEITCAKPPIAAFTPDILDCEAPCTVSFLNSSVNALSYQWNFGDGGSSSLEIPEHTFKKAGVYAVRLIAVGTSNCKDTIYKTIKVSGGVLPPVVEFSSNVMECTVGCIVKFTNKSLYASTFTWDFGDGTPPLVNPANIHPTHRFDCSGAFEVILTATGLGITVRDTQIIRIRTDQFVRIDDSSRKRDRLTKVFPTPDRGYLAIGYSEGLTNGGDFQDGIIGKWNAKGEKEWIKRYDENRRTEYFNDAVLLPDGSIIAVGSSNYLGWILRIDISGQILWQKKIEDVSDLLTISDIRNDVFYIVSFGAGIYIGKYDINGNTIWEKTNIYLGLSFPIPNDVAILPDGGAAIVGYHNTKGDDEVSSIDMLVLNCDASGNIRWYKTFGENGVDIATSIENTRDGGLIIGAKGNRSEYSGLGDFHLLKLNAAGQKQWAYSYPQDDLQIYDAWPAEVVETKNGDYFFNGWVDDYMSPNKPAVLLKVDKNGQRIWQKKLLSAGLNILNSIQPVPADCGYIMAGTKNVKWELLNFLLIKTDSDGNLQ